MNTKSAQIPVVKVLSILLFTTVLLSLFMFYLYLINDTATRDATYNQQIMFSNLMSEKCLLGNNNEVSSEKISKSTIDNCLENFDTQTTQVRITTSLTNIPTIYTGEENDFERVNKFCGVSSTHVCSPLLQIPFRSDSQKHNISIKFITQK